MTNSFAFFIFLAFQTVAMLSPTIIKSMTGYGNNDMLNDTCSKYYAPSEQVAGDEIIQFFKQNIIFKLYTSNTDLQIMKQSGYTYDVDIYQRMDRKSMTVDMTATQGTVDTLGKAERGAETEAACRLLFIAPLI
jgi:hypothetical protein